MSSRALSAIALATVVAVLAGWWFATRGASASWSPGDSLATVARHYHEAKDKRAFVDEALRVGGAAYARFASQALTDCGLVMRFGVAGTEPALRGLVPATDPEYAQRMQAFRELMKGCGGFEARPIPDHEAHAIHTRRNDGDDLLATFYRGIRKSDSKNSDSASIVDIARGLIEGGDPYVMVEVGDGIRALRSDAPRIREIDTFAWRLAACDLGMACGRDSPAVRAFCMAGRGCDRADYEAAVMNLGGYDAATREAIQVRRREVREAIPKRDWVRLGL